MRFVIVGLGRMGRVHLEAALSLGWSCVAAVEPFPVAEARAMLPDGTPLLKDYGPSISRLEPEAVILASTTDVRVDLLLEVLKKDCVKLVVTEKPLSASVAHAREVFNTAGALKKRVVVNHQMRFTPLYEYIADLVFSRRYGELASIYVAGSNFGLGNNVVHFVEIATYLFGSDPMNVRGQIDELPLSSHRGEQFRDHSGRLEVGFSNSRALTVEFMNSLGHGVLTVLNFSFAKILVNELSGDVTVVARKAEDFAFETERYGLEGVTETLNFGAINLLDGTTSFYQAAQADDDGMVALRRAVLAVEVASLALYSSRECSGLPLQYEFATTPQLMSMIHSWA